MKPSFPEIILKKAFFTLENLHHCLLFRIDDALPPSGLTLIHDELQMIKRSKRGVLQLERGSYKLLMPSFPSFPLWPGVHQARLCTAS